MTKGFWINLPVRNAEKSKDFFIKLGFSLNTSYNQPGSASIMIGEKKVIVMLFEDSTFQGFTSRTISEVNTSEVLLSIDAENKEEVDAMIKKAVDAGGKSNHIPYDMTGWMYGGVFSDLDGHLWNIIHMDMSKL